MLADAGRSRRCWRQVARVGAAALLAAGWAVLAGSPSLAASARDGHAAAVLGGARSHQPLSQPQPHTVADDGFRPQPDGFGFANYTNTLPSGETVTNLTAADMRVLFGDTVCAYHSGNQCSLTPEAQAWMREMNELMGGGHCFGMSVASLLMHNSTLSLWASAYGADQTVGLKIPSNTALQRLIAYKWVLQLIPAVYTKVVAGTPDQVLNRLIGLLPGTKQETPTISFWHRDFSGGHAVTPYAVKDLGGGKYEILVYDNNFPKTTREITVNTKANTWSYYAATHPGVPLAQYNGDARSETLRLYPATPGLSVQPSLFGSRLRASASSSGAQPSAGQFPVQIMLAPSDPTDLPRLLLTDDAGHHTGYLNGQQVNAIPGATVHYLVFGDWQNGPEPVYMVPAGTHVTLTVDGTTLHRAQTASVAVIGNGHDVMLDGIQVRPGDRLAINPAADGSSVRFATEAPQSATISLGASYPDSHYTITIGAGIPAGAELTAARLPLGTGQFSLGQLGGQAPGQYEVTVQRQDSSGVHYSQVPAITLQPNYGVTLNYRAQDQER